MTPTVKAVGSSVFVMQEAICCEFTRITDHRDTLSAEVTITSQDLGEIHWARVNLVSTQGRSALVKAAMEKDPGSPWTDIIAAACRALVRHLREGEPSVPLIPERDEAPRYLVPGLIPLNEVTVLFGAGGTGKSLLGLAIGVAGILGHPLSRQWSVGPLRRVLYLDWETEYRTHADRYWGLTTKIETPAAGAIRHRRMVRPLVDSVDSIQQEVSRDQVDLVICDSLVPACGPEPESSDASNRTIQALRGLGTITKLAIAHRSKASMNGTDKHASPFGSIFNENLPRSTIEARADDSDGDELVVTYHHRKNNVGRRARPSALSFLFDTDGSITIRGVDPDLAAASLPTQILAALKWGPRSVTDLADELAQDAGSIRTTMNRLKNRNNVIQLRDQEPGRGNKPLWCLVDRRREDEA